MKIYLTGQNNFGNRGCEALVRSTVLAVRSVLPNAEFLVPSADLKRDSAQWPEITRPGVVLVPAAPVPWVFGKWGGLCGRIPFIARLPWPALSRKSLDCAYIENSDLVLSIGGDNYSLDYGVSSLAYFVAVAELARSKGKPVALWGASVGPFSSFTAVELHMVNHLQKLSFISVRESRSVDYLAGIGVRNNVVPVIDTAFLMVPEPCGVDDFWPKQVGVGTVGLNISWLIEYVREAKGLKGDIAHEAALFVSKVLAETELSIVLIPHVAPLDGGERNSDDSMNKRIFLAIREGAAGRVGVVPPGMNAAQLKYIVSRCRFLLAARTHATIAAFSTLVPTISIAYSVKAVGINDDLFGHQRYVLETPSVSAVTLWAKFSILRSEEDAILAHYRQKLPEWRRLALGGAQRLCELVR